MAKSAEKEAARRRRREAALALRPSLSPAAPAPDRLRMATWNVNSLRARAEALERFLGRVAPDVLCLQETRAGGVVPAVQAVLDRDGYRIAHVGVGSRNGVAVAARHPIDDVVASGGFGDDLLDREPRVIAALVHCPEPVRVVSVYVPHGRVVGQEHYRFKLDFFAALAARVRSWLADGHVVLAGDVNVAATDSDVFHPAAFVGSTHVSPAERAALAGLLEAGLVDVDVARWGDRARRFTWWNYGIGYSRNLGMRLDVIACDPKLAERLDTTWIDHTERGAERPSDHAALIADFTPPAMPQ